MSDELPEGWANTTLGEVAGVALGKMLDKAKHTKGETLAYLRNANVRWNGFDLTDLLTMPFEQHERERFGLVRGDLLVCEGGEPGRAAIWPGSDTEIKYQKALLRVRPGEAVGAEWIRSALQRAALSGDLEQYFTGSTIKHFPRESIVKFAFPVAPLSEQSRIVEKAEALLDEVNRAKGRLDRVPLILKRFRQAVLAAACSGELTAAWAVQRGARTETWPGSEPHEAPDWLKQVPEAWSTRYLEDVSERVSVGHVGPTTEFYCSADVGVPFVRSQNVRSKRLVLDGVQYITRAFHDSLRKSKLRAGDILVVRVGANRGDVCVVPEALGEMNCANIVFARPMHGLSEWIELYANSPDGQKQLQEMTTGSAQGVLNTGSVAKLIVPLPPSDERAEIRARVAALFALADTIERRVQVATSRAEKLPQAILAKAFSGELVPTEAELARAEGRSYETAAELLERVRRVPEAKSGPARRSSGKATKRG